MTDNTRWNALQLRAGDIILSTPSKCGMTWTQRLVSLLVFDGPDLPGPLSTVSPWLDQAIRPIDEVVEVLDAQNHRRFIKTHTPLDGLPYDDGVTYLCVGRDPRDAAVSMLFQTANTDHERMRALIRGVSPAPDFRGDAEKFRAWMEGPALPPPGTGPGLPRGIGTLANILHHFGKTWERRDLANVALFHFQDYQSNLVAELMRLARVLEIDLRRDRACELARHASLETMRSRAWEMAPNSTDGVWLSDERFFRRGGRGDWRDYLSRRDTWRYYHRIKELAPPDLLAWAHGGRHGWDPTA